MAELLEGQIRYYRQRAAEYDATSGGVVPGLVEVLDRFAPAGDVLDLAYAHPATYHQQAIR